VHGHPPAMVLQIVREVASKGERKADSGQQAMPVLPPPRQGQAVRGQAEASISGVHSIWMQGRHAQKLHDLLKDILREEGQVHGLQEDDGWEESEEAWELGGAEGMIVGAVRQGEEYSWQDACEAWAAQDGEMETSVHQVGASGVGTEQGEENVHEGISEDEQSEAEAEGLLVEGEEREYVLELLMREVPPNLRAGVHPAKAEPYIQPRPSPPPPRARGKGIWGRSSARG
jgi:hypothetical protein